MNNDHIPDNDCGGDCLACMATVGDPEHIEAMYIYMLNLLKTGLEIHDEYLSQIATCVSQDYGRLNQFPIDCARIGIKLDL